MASFPLEDKEILSAHGHLKHYVILAFGIPCLLLPTTQHSGEAFLAFFNKVFSYIWKTTVP